MLRMSANGVSSLATEEGRKHQAYPDPKWGWATPTIGVGHTGPEVHPGLVWTDEQIDAALAQDIRSREIVVNDLVHVPLTQGQIDAVCSWGFNVGTGAMRSSTLMHELSLGHYQAAADEFLKWNIPDMLIPRRHRERAMFLGAAAAAIPIVNPHPHTTVRTADIQKLLGVPVDGVFGPQTATALANWQSRHGLIADGIVGPKTLQAMGF